MCELHSSTNSIENSPNPVFQFPFIDPMLESWQQNCGTIARKYNVLVTVQLFVVTTLHLSHKAPVITWVQICYRYNYVLHVSFKNACRLTTKLHFYSNWCLIIMQTSCNGDMAVEISGQKIYLPPPFSSHLSSNVTK